MDQIEAPDHDVWEGRRKCFEEQFNIEENWGAYILGEQATALLIDLQSIFCAGAFTSVLIVACTVIDAHLREAEADGHFDGGMQAAFSELSAVPDLDWLRKRRNRLVHFNRHRAPAITVDDQWSEREAHEADARRAVVLVSQVLFENPWV